ncbi:MAG: tetratricopeptide repeat protein [Dehalococcoidia bacterium]
MTTSDASLIPTRLGDRDVRLATAEAAFGRGDMAAADEQARRLIADDAEDARALLIAGAVALTRRRHDEALTLADRAVAAWTDGAIPASLWHNRGIALGGLGRIEDAVPSLAEAVQAVPHHRQYRTSLAMLLHASGRRDEAFEVAVAATGAPESVVAAAIAFERGELAICERLLDLARPGFEAGIREQLNEKQWTELKTYHRYLGRLTTFRRRHPEPPTRSRTPLAIVGDSHTLSPARLPLRVDGRPYVAVPRLVFGVKVWHLARARRGDPNLYATAFAMALAALAPGTVAAMSVGEIDCRVDEGFLPVLRREGNLTPEAIRERVHPAVHDAVAFAAAAAEAAGVSLRVITVPAPRGDRAGRSAEDTRAVAEVVRAVNEAIGEAAAAAGAGVLDLHRYTAGPDGIAKPGLHLDSVHLLPPVLGRAAR